MSVTFNLSTEGKGVPLDIFIGIQRVLDKKYPNKSCGGEFNRMLQVMRELADLYASLPEVEYQNPTPEPDHA